MSEDLNAVLGEILILVTLVFTILHQSATKEVYTDPRKCTLSLAPAIA